MNISASPIPKPSIIFNRANLTEMYFSPNATIKTTPSIKPSPSIIASISYKPFPSIIATPSVIVKPSIKVYPSYSPNKFKKNITSPQIKNLSSSSSSPSPSSKPLLINSSRLHSKYTTIQLVCFAFVLLMFYYLIRRCDRFLQAKLKKKVDIRVPVIIPEERVVDGAASRPTPPNSGGKSPRFMTVQKDCEV
jgi:hypothetical protein